MRQAQYQVTLNGFQVDRETYDDMLQFDGKRDEVQAKWLNTKIDADGNVTYRAIGETPVMGDVNNLPGRVNAGTASPSGGLRTGDSYPHDRPWLKRRTYEVKHPAFLNLPPMTVVIEPRPERPVPPIVIWEGWLTEKETVVVTPSLWEWDLGPGLISRFINWHAAVNDKFGSRAKEIFGKLPAVGIIFDAVDLGIDTAQFLTTVTGNSGSRPIGMQPTGDGRHTYVPQMLVLDIDRIEKFLTDNPTGKGPGIGMIELRDATEDLAGDYNLYWQVERLGPVQDIAETARSEGSQAGWRWCSRCQGLFYGPLVAGSSCPSGGPHADPSVSGSSNYVLRLGVPEQAGMQSGWRWCNNCQSLFFGPMHAQSACPAGGAHASPDVSGSANYSLGSDTTPRVGHQDQWRWCPKCKSLYFGPGRDASTCPSGGKHGTSPLTESSNYLLPQL